MKRGRGRNTGKNLKSDVSMSSSGISCGLQCVESSWADRWDHTDPITVILRLLPYKKKGPRYFLSPFCIWASVSTNVKIMNPRELLAQKPLLSMVQNDTSTIEEKWYGNSSFITKKTFPKRCVSIIQHIIIYQAILQNVPGRDFCLVNMPQVLAFNPDYLTIDFLKEELSIFSILHSYMCPYFITCHTTVFPAKVFCPFRT